MQPTTQSYLSDMSYPSDKPTSLVFDATNDPPVYRTVEEALGDSAVNDAVQICGLCGEVVFPCDGTPYTDANRRQSIFHHRCATEYYLSIGNPQSAMYNSEAL